MPDVLYLVNTVSSTSIPIEIGHAVDRHTGSTVTIGGLLESTDAPVDPDVREMDLPVERFGGSGNFDVGAYRRLVGHLCEREYDLVHTHHNFSGAVARTIGWVRGDPVVNTEHNDLTGFSVPQRVVNAVTFGFPSANVYNSQSTRGSLGPVERWLSNRDEVIYNGIDVERVTTARDCPLPVDLPTGTLVTNVGVMTEQKNQRAILRAAAEVAARSADVHFVIAGSGPLEADLKAAAARLGVDDVVTFTGYLPRREHVYGLLHRSDIFLVPSLYEGFCVAVAEAMACELPVIANDIGVLREVVGDHGIFVSAEDAQGLADRIIHTASKLDSESMRNRRRALRRRAVTEFPLEYTAAAYHDLYVDVCR